MTRARRSQGKLADSATKTPPSGGLPEPVSTTPVRGSPAKPPQSSTKSGATPKTKRRRKSASKAVKDSLGVAADETGSYDDGVVTFNFKDSGPDEQTPDEESKAGTKGPSTSSKTVSDGEASSTRPKPKASVEAQVVSDGAKSDHVQTTESGETVTEAKDAVATDTTEAHPGDEGTTVSAKKRKLSRTKQKKKQSKQKDDSKSDEAVQDQGISFYCGNLPPGVTREMLTYFLEEDGIHPQVRLHRQDAKKFQSLTPKQRQFKKNLKQIAKSVFATVVVQTEEEAEKMVRLDGVNMPSTSHIDYDTELKIVRRLPQANECPFKVHIRGLPPTVDEKALKTYLVSRALKPAMAVIFRNQKTQVSKGFGFVWFKTQKEAKQAIALPRPSMGGKLLVISASVKDKKALKKF